MGTLGNHPHSEAGTALGTLGTLYLGKVGKPPTPEGGVVSPAATEPLWGAVFAVTLKVWASDG